MKSPIKVKIIFCEISGLGSLSPYLAMSENSKIFRFLN